MSRSSYSKALDRLLRPLGFQREGSDWIRVRGELWECVNLQISWVAGVTANIEMKDLETEKILRSIPCEKPIFMAPISMRIGHLIDGYDRWWKNAPHGPAELVAAVETYGLPWLDKVRTPEDQATRWYGRETKRPWRGNMTVLPITLYRMGELAEALALFDAPVPKTANPVFVAQAKCVQLWLKQLASETAC